MEKYDLKEMVKDNKKVRFIFYRENELWYETETGFKFPVPISDTQGATFLVEDKATIFMTWIRAYMKEIEDAKNEEKDKETEIANG